MSAKLPHAPRRTPRLTREQLVAAARDPSLREAYHAAAAPQGSLQLQVPPTSSRGGSSGGCDSDGEADMLQLLQ